MSNIKPDSRPKLTKENALQDMKQFDLAKYPVKILGIRGYYKQSMGDVSKNDRSMYDDAICIIASNSFLTFNANTDPSRFQAGIATLVKNKTYLYKIGMHNMKAPYKALRQFGDVTITRDGKIGEITDSIKNRFFIDIHKGGYTTTSSLGCQTIHPDQWPEFISTIEKLLKENNQEIVPYSLIEY
jgi:lysozyme